MVAVKERIKNPHTAFNNSIIKDHRFRKTEKAIFLAISELILEKPMTVSLRPTELARRSKIAASTFYRHYSTIDEAIKHHEHNMMRRFRTMMQNLRDNHPNLKQCIERIIVFIYVNKDYFKTAISRGNRCPLKMIFEYIKPKIYHSCHLPKNSERMLAICFNEIFTLIEEWSKSSFPEEKIPELTSEIIYLLETAKKRLIRFMK